MLKKNDENLHPTETAPASARSRYGLDWLIFFVSDVQTGFGAFVAVFLTAQAWPQRDIGMVLTISGLVPLVAQIPIGALVDRLRSIRAAIGVALIAIGVCAFSFATWPVFPVVAVTRIVHALASSALTFLLVTLSLGLAGSTGISTRLGRNAAFASAGTGIAAAVMGACGYYVSSQAVFFLAASLVIPALYSLSRIRPEEIVLDSRDRDDAIAAGTPVKAQESWQTGLLGLARNRPLVIFAGCIVLFHLANAAMLPLAASMLTLRSSHAAPAMVAAAIVLPQLTVTFLSPWVGWAGQRWGRHPFLVLGFASLAVRGFFFAWTTDPMLLVLIQLLDGISAAVLGVLVPLTIADLARDSGHFNLAQGIVGSAVGIGAAISTTLAGWVSDFYGSYAAFLVLAVMAVVGVSVVAFVMPETRPRPVR